MELAKRAICEDRSLYPLFVMERKTEIKVNNVLRPLNEMPVQAYYNETLQLIDVLEWILRQVGRAKVWQTTFSMANEFLSRMYQLRKNGKVDVTEHVLVLDERTTLKTRKLWQFMQNVIPAVYMARTHAKFALVEGENGMKVTLLTSQNLTRGNRYESAVITCNEQVFDRLKSEMQEVINHKSKSFHELYRRTIEDY